MPYRARAADVLAAWRDVDRRLREMEPGREADRLLGELVRLREQYLSVVAEAAAAHAPEPPPFPEAEYDPPVGEG